MREGELLAHENRSRQRAVHARGQIDHPLVAADGAIGEQQIDDDAGLQPGRLAKLGLDRHDRRHRVFGAGVGEACLRLRRIGGALAKHIGALAVDRRRRDGVDQSIKRTVDEIARDAALQPRAKRFHGAGGVEGLAGGVERIEEGVQAGHIEGKPGPIGHGRNCRPRPRGVTHAELVIEIGVEKGEIDNGVFGEQQALAHRPTRPRLVGADGQ